MTPEQIEQEAFEARLAEEEAAGLVAIAILIDELGLPEGSSVEEITEKLDRRGIGPDEALDWLRACQYEAECFRTELRYQMRAAKKRQKAKKTAKLAVAFGLVALAGGAWVVMRRR